MYHFPRLLLSVTLGVIILSACAFGSTPTPAQSDNALPQGPKAGTPMAWVDGSTLIFIPEPNGIDYYGSRGFWITFKPISNYQFSLCVQSKKCKSPNSEGYNDPDKRMDFFSISDSTIVGPDHSAGYCDWIFGRNPTEYELDLFLNSVGDGLPKNGKVSFDDLGLMPGGVFGIQDDSVRCIVANPTPHHMYRQTTPYYNLDITPEDMEAQVTGSQNFCQNGLSYQTLDLAVPENHSIQSVSSAGGANCETLENNRVVCYGSSNTNPQAQVSILCNELGVFSCQPGANLDGGVCSGQISGRDIAGLQDFHLDENGYIVPTNGRQLTNACCGGEITQSVLWINGTFVVQDTQSSSLPSHQDGTILVSFPNPISEKQQFYFTYFVPYSKCPAGYYESNGQCIGGGYGDGNEASPGGGAQSQQTCLAGFHYNIQTMRCEADLPTFNYPGCPSGSLMYIETGKCDIETKVISPSKLVHEQAFDLELQDCSAPESNQGNGNDSGGLSCKPGETLVCPDPKDPKSCYCK